MRRSIENLNRIIAIALIMAIVSSCTMDLGGPKAMSERLLISRSARLMEVYIDEVAAAISDDELPGFREAWQRGFSSEDVARGTLSEEGGREYLEFTIYANDYESVDEVISSASALAPESELEGVREQIEELEKKLYEGAAEDARLMTEAQKKAFYSELRKLVVKAFNDSIGRFLSTLNSKSTLYTQLIERLNSDNISRDERLKTLCNIERCRWRL